MTRDEFRETLKREVDLFTMSHGGPPFSIHVNDQAFDLLRYGSPLRDCYRFLDADVVLCVHQPLGIAFELWRGGDCRIFLLTSLPLRS